VALAFAEIIWPDGWELPWVGKAARDAAEALAKEYGQPFYTSKEGRVTGINERYWAALYAREIVCFMTRTKIFLPLRFRQRAMAHNYAGKNPRRYFGPDSGREPRGATVLPGNSNHAKQAQGGRVRIDGLAEKRGAFRIKGRFIHVANGVIRFGDDGDVKFGGYSPEDYPGTNRHSPSTRRQSVRAS